MFSRKPLVFLAQMNQNTLHVLQKLATNFGVTLAERPKPPTFAPATETISRH